MLWRLVRTILLFGTGAIAGFAAATAMLRGWLRSRGDEAADAPTLEIRATCVMGGVAITR